MSISHWSFKATCIIHLAFRGCLARLSTRWGCAQQVQPRLTSMLHSLAGFPQISSLPVCVQHSVLYLLHLVRYLPCNTFLEVRFANAACHSSILVYGSIGHTVLLQAPPSPSPSTSVMGVCLQPLWPCLFLPPALLHGK